VNSTLSNLGVSVISSGTPSKPRSETTSTHGTEMGVNMVHSRKFLRIYKSGVILYVCI